MSRAVYRDNRCPLAPHASGEFGGKNSTCENVNEDSTASATSWREGRCGGPKSRVSSRPIHVSRNAPPGRTTRATSAAYWARCTKGRVWKQPLSMPAPKADLRNGIESALPSRKTAEEPLRVARRRAASIAPPARSTPVARNPLLESQSTFVPAPQPMSTMGPGGRIPRFRTARTSQGEGREEYQGSWLYGVFAYVSPQARLSFSSAGGLTMR